jgi:hypothetical protein
MWFGDVPVGPCTVLTGDLPERAKRPANEGKITPFRLKTDKFIN